ncbi:MAG TPA: 6-phosphofructokinase [Caldilineae bacterium]|nr:6-phosphofructokinase [Caldilineae bacterium]
MSNRLGVLTSGGDAPGMNAAVRAVVRAALDRGVEVYAIYEGYQGMVDGGDKIQPLGWRSVSGILQKGGTMIGTARCAAFRTREGRRKAVRNLLEHGIDRLVIIGGDGSLIGAHILCQEWPELVSELVRDGEIPPEVAERHPYVAIAGLVGSIDNDVFGTEMSIGADTALHRITEAVDAISSTAASHQRTFVIEVMGRRCGYLALMGALATGANWVLIPESPPDMDDWEERMCEVLRAGRQAGRRESIVIVAEGAQDHHGNPITAEYVRQVLEERLGEEARVTILGHVQRGGPPSAFDRNLSTLLGIAAVEELLAATPESPAYLIGLRENRITRMPLEECVKKTQEVNEAIEAGDYERAMALRGKGFQDAFRTLRTLLRAVPHPPRPGQRRLRLAVLTADAPAPGMNTAVRAAVRVGLDMGHVVLGVRNGLRGLVEGNFEELEWMSVTGWASHGGSTLGTSREIPEGSDLYAIARNLEEQGINGLLIIGGWAGYEAALRLHQARGDFPSFDIPIVCLPASINNDLPGSELSVGADTALNNIVDAVDKIKQSAGATHRCFVVEVMGRYCGYLALMSALATGAERVYLHEEGITLRDLEEDLRLLVASFEAGKNLGLMIRNERANPLYTTDFIRALLEEEGGDLFEVRQAVLGHLQQGGDPTPFDRILATRLAVRCVAFLSEQAGKDEPASACVGLVGGEIRFTDLEEIPRIADMKHRRPKQQWWMDLRPIARMLAQPYPGFMTDRGMKGASGEC